LGAVEGKGEKLAQSGGGGKKEKEEFV